jgi:hypothetical protein
MVPEACPRLGEGSSTEIEHGLETAV